LIAATGFYFAQPWWLVAGLLAVPAVWLGVRSMQALSPARRWLALTLRVAVLVLLAGILARPTVTETNEQMTLIVVLDRSQSVPQALRQQGRDFLTAAAAVAPPRDRLAVVDVAEAATIARLPSTSRKLPERNTTLNGLQSNLAGGVQMALAISPPETAVRLLLASDGNETEGDLREMARIAAANNIAVDVLPLRYGHSQEVVFKRLVAPSKARSGQTVTLRFVLHSTSKAAGKLQLTLNGKPVDMDPGSDAMAVPVQLQPGTNVRSISLPVGMRGVHDFRATFLPSDANQDGITQNNEASAMTFVAGPGYVIVADADGKAGAGIVRALGAVGVEAKHVHASALPHELPALLSVDALVLVNTDSSLFSFQQQKMLVRYVNEMGGGLLMVGGPQAFGAGGWIGSPVAKVLPVDLDPPQKKEMPKGALVLIMHACEMPRGNHWGKKVGIAAVNALGRRDLVGVQDYRWEGGAANWVYPLSPVGDKTKVIAAIKKMEMGDMPDLAAPMQAAFNALKACDAVQKHIIIISDGDPSPPAPALLKQMKAAKITCTGVAVFPHSPQDVKTLAIIAQVTGGRFYSVKKQSELKQLPRIFIKEAQVVRRALINEETFTPKIAFSPSEVLKGLPAALPPLDGYVLTGPKGGLTQALITGPEGDPILATGQAGLGRCAAFMSSADARWAGKWLGWGGYTRFWEQAVRWVSKSSRPSDCEIFADVEGRNVTLTVEAVDAEGNFVQFSGIIGQTIAPDMSAKPLELGQVGPGRYQAKFRAGMPGTHLVTFQYRRPGDDQTTGLVESAVTVPYAPEFRDLSDNFALLAEVARITGGRVIGGDPQQAKLFDKQGLSFPKTATTLTKPLLLVWLVLFLLDVAVRRLAVDFRAAARRVGAWVWRTRRSQEAGETVDRLRQRREQTRRQLDRAQDKAVAAKRYDAPDGSTPVELPSADLAPPRPAKPEAATPEPAEKKPKAPPESSHLQRLLKAKQKSRDRMQQDNRDSKP